MDDELSATFEQSQGLGRRLRLEARDGHLHVHWREGASEYQDRIPLQALDENTMSLWSLGRPWRVGATSVAVVGAILLVIWVLVCHDRHLSYRHSLGIAGGLCLLCAAVLAGAGRFLLQEHILIFSRIDGSQLLSLHSDVPAASEVQAFLDALLEEARRLSQEIEDQAILSHERYNAATEIRKFHQLHKSGVIDADEFARKKKALLEGFLKE